MLQELELTQADTLADTHKHTYQTYSTHTQTHTCTYYTQTHISDTLNTHTHTHHIHTLKCMHAHTRRKKTKTLTNDRGGCATRGAHSGQCRPVVASTRDKYNSFLIDCLVDQFYHSATGTTERRGRGRRMYCENTRYTSQET